MKELELYIHIPFCKEKCNYCDFLSFKSSNTQEEDYVHGLINEIKLHKSVYETRTVRSVFIGGGTPSILAADLLKDIMDSIYDTFKMSSDVEISIEVNPQTVDKRKIKVYKEIGINRISLGLQASNDEELKVLGRIHSYKTFLETYDMVREVGIHNINVDLMSAIPGQTLESWKETLERVIELQPEHISAYSLIIEEGTKFYQEYSQEAIDICQPSIPLPSEDTEREMYYLTRQKLLGHGYHRYEISNYAKKTYECKHNLGYWEGIDYIGFGLGASSLITTDQEKRTQYRYSNLTKLKDYIFHLTREDVIHMEPCASVGWDSFLHSDKVMAFRHQCNQLSVKEQMEEFMFLGLRKIHGISKIEFEALFQHEISQVYGEVLSKMYGLDLLEEEDNRIKFTEKGIDVSNYVLSEFL